MPEITPAEATSIQWREAGAGSWTDVPNPIELRFRCYRFAKDSGAGRIPDKPRIRGEIVSRGIDQHLAMMDQSEPGATLAEIRCYYTTEEGQARVVTITSVMFCGEGQVVIGRRTDTAKRADADACVTPFEVNMTQVTDEFTDYITDAAA